MTLPRHSLLDAAELPVVALARIAMREGVRPRPAYQAHKWFARRLAVTARSLLVSAATPAGGSFWKSYFKGDTWAGHTVLDPFVGGGVMLLEAARLGATVHGVDIEPVAAAIAKFQTTLPSLPDLDPVKTRLIEEVGARLAPYYEAEDASGTRETLLHAFWVQAVECGACAHRFDAHPNYRLAWDDPSSRQWVICKGCGEINQADSRRSKVSCACGVETDSAVGNVEDGACLCPACNHMEPLIAYARRRGERPSFRLFAVETLPAGKEVRLSMAQRRIRKATAFDQARYAQAEQELETLLEANPNLLPTGLIPSANRSDNRLVDYGYTHYEQLFNARQKLHLALLGRAILRLPSPERDAMAVAFSDHLTTNNLMCGYAGGWRRLTPLFSIRAYRHIVRPVEINPWLQRNGRGTFPNAIRSVCRASESMKSPEEPTVDGARRKVTDSVIGACDVICGDARHLRHIPSDSVDLVLTDPPYFDYIAYSELGHFFTPWLARFRLIRASETTGFPPGQLASAKRSREAETVFARNLTAAFKEMKRVCRDDGRIAFTYQNLDGRGWHAIAAAMARAGVIPIQTFPLFGESGTGLHKHAHSISWDCVMVCRPGTAMPRLRVNKAAIEVGNQHAKRWGERLQRNGLSTTDGDRVNIAYAHAILEAFGRRAPQAKTAQKQA